MRFQILGSSSSGNCALLVTPQCKVLIDAGFSARRTAQMLAEVGESIDQIEAVFITHEHGDHCAGLKGLAKLPEIRFFANRSTAFKLDEKFGLGAGFWQLFETGRPFRYKDLRITPFAVPHDAQDPVGFVFESGEGTLFSPHRRVAWLTDLGHLSPRACEHARQADVLVLEANYDHELLEKDEKRPWHLKQRIGGRHGHLSNQAAFELLSGQERARWQHVFLVHLSRDCNSLECVKRTFAPLWDGRANYRLDVVHPENGTPPACDLTALSI